MQNFRNGSKSALRKSKNYIYEHDLGKIFEIYKKYIYMNIYTYEHASLYRRVKDWRACMGPEWATL